MSLEALIKSFSELDEYEPEERANEIINRVAQFLCEKFGVNDDEVSFLFVDEDRLFLRFLYPSHLKDAGLLPVKFTESLATQAFNLGLPRLVNNLPLTRHFALFEMVKTGKGSSLPVQKMIVSPIITPEGDKIGVVQILRKANRPEEVEDFTEADLDYLSMSISKLSPYLKQLAGYKVKK